MSERKSTRLVCHPGSGRTAVVPRSRHPLPVPTIVAARSLAPLAERRGTSRATPGGGARAPREVITLDAPAPRPAPAGGVDARWVRLSVATAGLATVFSLLALLK
jgi:hypothetical protein